MLNKKKIENTTWFNKKYYENLKSKIDDYDNDINKDRRFENFKCKHCFYLRRDTVSGSAFTQYDCIDCGSEEVSSNTNVDKLCLSCAKNNNACKHCGGQMD